MLIRWLAPLQRFKQGEGENLYNAVCGFGLALKALKKSDFATAERQPRQAEYITQATACLNACSAAGFERAQS